MVNHCDNCVVTKSFRLTGDRPFSSKEVEYIRKLIGRNAGLVHADLEHSKSERLWCSGLERPMSGSERKMRQRIRKKAKKVAILLGMVWQAGILPDRELCKVQSAAGMMKDISMALSMQMVFRS